MKASVADIVAVVPERKSIGNAYNQRLRIHRLMHQLQP